MTKMGAVLSDASNVGIRSHARCRWIFPKER